jgi:hypothetical protein
MAANKTNKESGAEQATRASYPIHGLLKMKNGPTLHKIVRKRGINEDKN